MFSSTVATFAALLVAGQALGGVISGETPNTGLHTRQDEDVDPSKLCGSGLSLSPLEQCKCVEYADEEYQKDRTNELTFFEGEAGSPSSTRLCCGVIFNWWDAPEAGDPWPRQEGNQVFNCGPRYDPHE